MAWTLPKAVRASRCSRLDRCAIDALLGYPWPGNVRELENVISRVVLRLHANVPRGEPIVITARDLAADVGHAPAPTLEPRAQQPASQPKSLREASVTHQRILVERALAEHQGNLAAAARALGMDRGNFHRLVKRLRLGKVR